MRARVNLDADRAKADAEAIKRDIEELRRQKAEIDVTVRAAKAELELQQIEKRLQKLNTTPTDIEIGLHGPWTEIQELEMAIRAIDEQDVSIEVELDAMKAVKDAAALNAELDALIDEHKEIKVDVDRSGIDMFREAVQSATFSLGKPGMMGTLIGGVVLLASTLGPLTAAAAGVSAGMVGSFSVMGASVGAFAALAIPTFKEVAEGFKILNTETKNLSPEKLAEYKEKLAELKAGAPGVYQAAQAVKSLADRFKELAENLRPIVIGAMVSALGAANIVLEEMAPVAMRAGRAIRDLMRDAKEGLKGEEWQTFFSYLQENARGFTQVWGETWGNFITGIANMIVAFDPLTKFVNQGFLSMSESFREWSRTLSDNPGFKDFVNYVKVNGPIIWDNLGKIVIGIKDLFVALEPLGMKVITTIGSLFEAISNLVTTNPELARFAATVAVLAAAIIPLVSPLAGVVGPLMGIATAFGAIGAVSAGVVALVGALTGIGIGLALVTDTGEPFKAMWESIKSLWEGVKESAGRVKGRLSELWEFLREKGVIENFQIAIKDLAVAFKQMLPAIELVATIIGGALLVGLFTVGTGFRTVATIVRSTVEGFKRFWGVIKELPAKLGQAKEAAVQKWRELRQRLIEATNQMYQSVKQKFEQIKNSIREKISSAVQTARQKFSEMKQAVQTSISAMVQVVRDKVQQIISAIRDKFSQAPGVVREKINSAKQALVSAMQAMVAAAGRAMSNIIQAIRTKLGQAKAAVTGAFAGAASWLFNAGASIISGLISGITSKIGAVKSKLSELTSLIPKFKGPEDKDKKLLRPVGKMIMDGLIKGFDDGIPGVEAVLTKITNLINQTMDKRFKDNEVASENAKRVIKSLDDEMRALLLNAKARENVMDKIDKQKEKLQGLIEAQKQYAESVKESFMNFGSVGGLGGRTDEEGNSIAPTAGAILEDLRSKVGQAEEYKGYMEQLMKMGVNKDTLDQLTQMGVEAGLSTAKAIVEGGSATVLEINALTERLKLTGKSMGEQVSKEMYKAGKESVRGVIRGLREMKAELVAVARELGRAMTAAFRKELKIKSPSRIFIDYGHMTGEGLIKGLKDELPGVEATSKKLSDTVRDSFVNIGALRTGTVAPLSVDDTHSSSINGDDSTPTPVEVRVFIGDRELTDIVKVEIGETIKPLRTKTRQGAI